MPVLCPCRPGDTPRERADKCMLCWYHVWGTAAIVKFLIRFLTC